jgi:hypothetical protein
MKVWLFKLNSFSFILHPSSFILALLWRVRRMVWEMALLWRDTNPADGVDWAYLLTARGLRCIWPDDSRRRAL